MSTSKLLLLICYLQVAIAFRPYLIPRQASIDLSDYPALTIDIPVDHYNDSDKRSYSNRYWINSTYYKAGGPVFYFDSGEQNAHPLVPYFLAEAAGPSAVITLAKRFNGLAVLFEHRFYGDLHVGSYPFPMNATSGMPLDPAAAYRYLNTEQALQDPVYFAHHFQPKGLEAHWKVLSPTATPWIWLGGSYPGIRGAQMRVRNPETFFASWASSAPTQAAVDMWVYYAAAERSMTRNCSADYTAITRHVDSVLANGSKTEVEDLKVALYTAILSKTGGVKPTSINRTEAMAMSNGDVASNLLTPLSFYQYYGFERSVQPFCDIMETQNRTQLSTTDNGGTSTALTHESGLYAATGNITLTWENFLTGIAEIDYDSVPSPANDPIGDSSWGWQYCSEYGYYQRGNPSNPHTIESQYISLESYQARCDSDYGSFGLPSTPNVSASNKYGGWHINPSNTMFTSGEYDPWRTLSPASIDSQIGAPMRQTVQTIPVCGVSPPPDRIFGLIHRDMVHVSDMRALLDVDDPNHQNFQTVGFSSPISTEPFYSGVGLFGMALDMWMPCFRAT